VWVQLIGFRRIPDEVVFVEMEPRGRSGYEPLVGYAILEGCGLVIDMVTHRLHARKTFDAKLLARAAG